MPPNILIVTRHTPLPWDDGAGAYLHDVARHLATHGFRVEVLWLAPPEDLRWQKVWQLPAAFDPSIQLTLAGSFRCGRRYLFPAMIWYPLKARALHRVRQVLTSIGLAGPRRSPVSSSKESPVIRPWMSPPTPAESAVVETHLRHRPAAIVIASYAWLCPLLALPARRMTRCVCLTHDVASQRARLAAAENGSGAPAEISRPAEAAWLQSADTIIAISESDAVELRALNATATVVVAPKACRPLDGAPAAPDLAAARLLFVGSGNRFNVAGLTWFLQEVWPHVRATAPGAHLDVCGSIDRVLLLRPEDVTFHGSVPDLTSFYQAAAVVVVPLLHASGLNIKLVDAAAAGRAIVASSITLTGAPFLRGAIHDADSAAAFAAAVHLLLTDSVRNARAAAAALAAVRTHLNPAACYGPLLARLRFAA